MTLLDRIGQRKSLLDVLVSDWSRYVEAGAQLNSVLDTVESTLSSVSIDGKSSIMDASKLQTILKVLLVH